MHPSAMRNAKDFFDVYAKHKDGGTVIDIGSQDVNGTLRSVCPDRFKYVGVDFQKALNVDVVLTDPYKLPFENNSIDIVVSSSCLEHSDFFWMTFLEMVRVAKHDGLIYINVPSEGPHHSYPVDCWRFRIDAAHSLKRWVKTHGYSIELLESFIDPEPVWHDFVAIYAADSGHAGKYPDRIKT